MKVRKTIALELVVAAFTLAVAGAFTHVSVSGEAPALLTVMERQANELGKKIFLGKGNCATCHGQDLKGGPLGPNLTDGEWLNIDGSEAAIATTVKQGVMQPKKHPAPMPPMGGAKLSDKEVQAVSEFVHQQSLKQ